MNQLLSLIATFSPWHFWEGAGLAFLIIRGMVGRKHGVSAGVWGVPKGLLFALSPPAAASRMG